MTDIARMRFQSSAKPEESGALALSTDGTVRIEPSDAMIEAVARLEQEAVETSSRVSGRLAFVLIGLGLAAAAVGWLAGRIGGRLRDRLTESRRVDRTKLLYARDLGLQIRFKSSPIGSTSLTWSPGEYNVDEAEAFVDAYERMKQAILSD